MQAAGRLIEDYRQQGFATRQKAASRNQPQSPVTDADEEAEALLTQAIRQLDNNAIIVGEEASAAGRQPAPAARFWLIDPLDGTRDYVEGGLDYTVNIGLIENAAPVLGLVLHPPTATLWAGGSGLGAWKEQPGQARVPIHGRPCNSCPVVTTSRAHLEDRTRNWLGSLGRHEAQARGSSLKFCLLAEGAADIYPRFGPTSEWDTAAADAILRAAGGLTLAETSAEGSTPFRYGKADYLNGPFLALGDPAAASRLPAFHA